MVVVESQTTDEESSLGEGEAGPPASSLLIEVARAGRPGEVELSSFLGLRRRSRVLCYRVGVEDGGDGFACACCFAFNFVAHALRAPLRGRVGLVLLDPRIDGEASFVSDVAVAQRGHIGKRYEGLFYLSVA